MGVIGEINMVFNLKIILRLIWAYLLLDYLPQSYYNADSILFYYELKYTPLPTPLTVLPVALATQCAALKLANILGACPRTAKK